MRIAATSASFPSRAISNAQMLDMVESCSRESFEGPLDDTLATIDFYLKHSGAQTRYWLDSDESAFELVERAVQGALERANLKVEDIDVLIHASVDRRVMEPGMSFLLAKALGFQRTQCFDILEACNSWSRAMQIAQALTSTEENILIITSEFLAHDHFEGGARLRTPQDLEWAFPTFTIGESATATIVTRDDSSRWQFAFTSIPQHADLCMLPSGEYGDQVTQLNGVDLNAKGPGKFVSYARKMQPVGKPELIRIVQENTDAGGPFDVVFPHSHTARLWTEITAEMKWDMPLYMIYPSHGNLVTSSIPAAMYLAEQDGTLKRGDRAAGWMAAAGLSFSFYQFTF